MSKSFRVPTNAQWCTMSWTSYATSTSDGAVQGVSVSGDTVWQETVTGFDSAKGECGQPGWELAPGGQFPAPEASPNAKTCYKKVAVTFPCAGVMRVAFKGKIEKVRGGAVLATAPIHSVLLPP